MPTTPCQCMRHGVPLPESSQSSPATISPTNHPPSLPPLPPLRRHTAASSTPTQQYSHKPIKVQLKRSGAVARSNRAAKRAKYRLRTPGMHSIHKITHATRDDHTPCPIVPRNYHAHHRPGMVCHTSARPNTLKWVTEPVFHTAQLTEHQLRPHATSSRPEWA